MDGHEAGDVRVAAVPLLLNPRVDWASFSLCVAFCRGVATPARGRRCIRDGERARGWGRAVPFLLKPRVDWAFSSPFFSTLKPRVERYKSL